MKKKCLLVLKMEKVIGQKCLLFLDSVVTREFYHIWSILEKTDTNMKIIYLIKPEITKKNN